MKNFYQSVIFAAIIFGVSGNASAEKIKRSKKAIAEFQRQNPCPENGQRRGKCHGFQIDHVNPLKCGGPDLPENMQWLSVNDHKAKTKREAKLCRKKLNNTGVGK